jgi:hypothetical protein
MKHPPPATYLMRFMVCLMSSINHADIRFRKYDGLKKIIVGTNSHLIAPHNYESVGFKLCQRRKNESDTLFSGDYLDYEIIL